MTKDLKVTQVTDRDYAIGDTPTGFVDFVANYISQNNTPLESQSDDSKAMKKSLLNNQYHYMRPHFGHHFYGDIELEEEPFYSDEQEFDSDGHALLHTQEWELSFPPSQVQVIIAENADSNNVIVLLEKIINTIKLESKINPDLFVADPKEKSRLLESIADSARMAIEVKNHFSNVI